MCQIDVLRSLMSSAANDQAALIDMLISFNAHLDIEDEEGHTPASLYALKGPPHFCFLGFFFPSPSTPIWTLKTSTCAHQPHSMRLKFRRIL
jgi:hypothetical protein